MEFSVQFDSKYKGKFKDIMIGKVATFFGVLVTSLVLLGVGIYLAFGKSYGVANQSQVEAGITIMTFGGLMAAASPFIGLFKGVNRGLNGLITVTLKKVNNRWVYTIQAIKNKLPYFETGIVELININKRVAVLSIKKGRELTIPLRFLSEEQRSTLTEIEKEIRDFRIKETQEKQKQK